MHRVVLRLLSQTILTWDGASASDTDDTGDIAVVSIDMVGGGDVSIIIGANVDSATAADTNLTTSLTLGDSGSASITGTGGIAANPLDHDLISLVLDDTETRTLTVTGAAYTGIDTGAISAAAALETMTVTSAIGADTDIGTLSAATSLDALTLSATRARLYSEHWRNWCGHSCSADIARDQLKCRCCYYSRCNFIKCSDSD